MIGSRRSARYQRQAAHLVKLAAVAEENAARGVAYTALADRIVAARLAVVGDPRHPGSRTEQRAAHQLLTSLLGDAVTTAFAADASGTSCRPGIAGWAGEGLARSTEREIAIFAALDAGSPLGFS